MPEQTKSAMSMLREAGPLYDATRGLLGYFLATAYRNFLSATLANMRKWADAGRFDADGRPTAVFKKVLFDFEALDPEAIAYFCGLYFYVYSSHKKANFSLLHNASKKRVLYLRGYDYEASVGVDGIGMGISTLDTSRFNHQLGEQLGAHFEVFKVLSPTDLYQETIGPQRHFYGDPAGIIKACSTPIRSVYLNARSWQEGIVQLAHRMDYFVVYVSSITESVLWEIGQLKKGGYAARTTIVFDRDAIITKDIHAGFYEKLPGLDLGELLWLPSKKRSTAEDVDALRAELEKTFTVVSADAFEAGAEVLKARIETASSAQAHSSRATCLAFDFQPALDDAVLAHLRELDGALWREIDPEAAGEIECLPFYLNQVQLRIFTSLLFGAHDDAGRALAVYSGLMAASVDLYTTAAASNERISAHDDAECLAMLRELRDTTQRYAWTFLCSGKSHEFGDYTGVASATCDRIISAARQRMERLLGKTMAGN